MAKIEQEKVLIVGNGGRESALAWKLSKSPLLSNVYMTQPTPGAEKWTTPVDTNPNDISGLQYDAKRLGINLVIFGPESPLIAGGGDAMREANIPFWGHLTSTTMLEASKVYTHHLAKYLEIPQPDAFIPKSYDEAVAFVHNSNWGKLVIKADGEAAGKGVLLPEDPKEGEENLHDIMIKGTMGEGNKKVIIQKREYGPEDSLIAFVAGSVVIPFPLTTDHKRLLNGDKGPNTGGMGAVIRPNSRPSREMVDTFIGRTARFLEQDGKPLFGWLFAGIIHTPEGDKLLEYNIREGDPGTQAHMRVLNSDLYKIIREGVRGRLYRSDVQFDYEKAVAAIVMASEGYPIISKTGRTISGLDEDYGEDIVIFEAGTKRVGNEVLTSGQRVLSVTATGETLAEAKRKASNPIVSKRLRFDGSQYRTDIGKRI